MRCTFYILLLISIFLRAISFLFVGFSYYPLYRARALGEERSNGLVGNGYMSLQSCIDECLGRRQSNQDMHAGSWYGPHSNCMCFSRIFELEFVSDPGWTTFYFYSKFSVIL